MSAQPTSPLSLGLELCGQEEPWLGFAPIARFSARIGREIEHGLVGVLDRANFATTSCIVGVETRRSAQHTKTCLVANKLPLAWSPTLRLAKPACSLTAGWHGGRYPKHILLGLLYILRVFTAQFVLPPTPTTTPVFATAMGMLWLSVSPLISGLVAEMFGTRYMATLFGISFVMHQAGFS